VHTHKKSQIQHFKHYTTFGYGNAYPVRAIPCDCPGANGRDDGQSQGIAPTIIPAAFGMFVTYYFRFYDLFIICYFDF